MFAMHKHNPTNRSIIDHYIFKYHRYNIGIDVIDDTTKIAENKYSIYCKFKIMYRKHWHVTIDAVCKVEADSAAHALRIMKESYYLLFVANKFKAIDWNMSLYGIINRIMIIWYWIYLSNPIQHLLDNNLYTFKKNMYKYLMIFMAADMHYIWDIDFKLFTTVDLFVENQHINRAIVTRVFGDNTP